MSQSRRTLVWDLPLRIWHWAFALCVAGSLYTGLSGDIGLIERHQLLGYCMAGLLLFRLAWGICGGRYARLGQYRVSLSGILAHFRGHAQATPHTAPGVVMAVVFVVLVVVQVGTGLFATDDIFTEGPLTGYVEAATAKRMTWIHHRVFWLICAAITVHLTAHLVYGLRRDSTPLSMITGRKPVSFQPKEADLNGSAPVAGRMVLGLTCAVLATGLVWGFLWLA